MELTFAQAKRARVEGWLRTQSVNPWRGIVEGKSALSIGRGLFRGFAQEVVQEDPYVLQTWISAWRVTAILVVEDDAMHRATQRFVPNPRQIGD
jgi:hypothetical protein